MVEASTLELTRKRVERAAERIQDQAVLIEWLKKEGHDTVVAEHLLATFVTLTDVLTNICGEMERQADARSPLPSSEV
jgi:hypothetical protein